MAQHDTNGIALGAAYMHAGLLQTLVMKGVLTEDEAVSSLQLAISKIAPDNVQREIIVNFIRDLYPSAPL